MELIGYLPLTEIRKKRKTDGLFTEWAEWASHNCDSARVQIGEGTIIYPGVVIYADSTIGKYCILFHNVLIRERVRIGDKVKIGSNSSVERDAIIEFNVRISSDTKIGEECIIKSGAFIGNNVTFSCDRYPPSNIVDPIIIEEEATIGAGVCLCPGVRVGRGVIVGVGAVVTKNLPSGYVYYGNPATPQMTIHEFEQKKQQYLQERPHVHL